MISPTREDITRRAEELWRKRRCPVGQDNQIWLAAECQLAAEAEQAASSTPGIVPAAPSNSTAALMAERRAQAGIPRASVDEAPIAPPISEGESLRAAIQRTEAREPIVQTKFAPVAAVANSGKPLWPRPHAS